MKDADKQTRFYPAPNVVEQAVLEMIRERNIAVESLTEKQLAECFIQACKCGDFVRMLAVDMQSQQVYYIPHREHERMQEHINDLKAEVAQLKLALGRQEAENFP